MPLTDKGPTATECTASSIYFLGPTTPPQAPPEQRPFTALPYPSLAIYVVGGNGDDGNKTHLDVSDAALLRVCLAFQLNGYGYDEAGDGRAPSGLAGCGCAATRSSSSGPAPIGCAATR